MEIEYWDACPKNSLKDESPSSHLVQLALLGYPQLAADTVLNKEYRGKLLEIVQGSIRLLSSKVQQRENEEGCIVVLLELALNLIGMERKRVGFSIDETKLALDEITSTLKTLEDSHEAGFRTVIERILKEMKMVLKGKSMVAMLAEDIEKGLVENNLGSSFISMAKQVIETNVYYKIVDQGLSKFGNDSATGLRWVRHLGAVQVSSNPVIAARAFDEILKLWKIFERVAISHPEWRKEPLLFGDEIALFGTITSLLPNVLDFRPIALQSDFKDGMVSIQLNPHRASSVEGSLSDALKMYSVLAEILSSYDNFLLNGSQLEFSGRPNVVFKVATVGPNAIALTESLDKRGQGTNNTVTFTVSQEIRIVISALKGLSDAEKKGIPIGRVYITNMEGRLEDHLRECVARELLEATLRGTVDRRAAIRSIAAKSGASAELEKNGRISEEARIEIIASKRYLKSLNDKWFTETIGADSASTTRQAESDIQLSGVFVTRKVFDLVFSPKVRPAWLGFIKNEFGLSEEASAQVFDLVDLLPSSKRRHADTYLVLGSRTTQNLTNTEFPDHQVKVLQRSKEEGFQMFEYENSIAKSPDPSILVRLLEIPDFKKAYELTSELTTLLDRIGIKAPKNENSGLGPEEWQNFGPSRKTMSEFEGAYDQFKENLVSFIMKEIPELAAQN